LTMLFSLLTLPLLTIAPVVERAKISRK
jgi:hypothetical protein